MEPERVLQKRCKRLPLPRASQPGRSRREGAGQASPSAENGSSANHFGNSALPFAPVSARLFENNASSRRGPSSSSAMKPGSRLLKQGRSHRTIAQQLHLHRESLIRSARAERFREKPLRSVSPGLLAPYEPSLRVRFVEGGTP